MKTFAINKSISIDAEYYETRYSWGHKAYLYIDGQEVEYAKVTYYNRTWESYQFQSILFNIVRKTKALTPEQKTEANEYIKNYDDYEARQALKNIAMVAQLGNLFTETIEQKNDWKERMLKAGLENKGLIMPTDWNELTASEKEKRLDLVIQELAK